VYACRRPGGELADHRVLGGRTAARQRGALGDRDHESLRDDFSWKSTPVIVEWERGDFDDELVEVSHEQASKIIEYFRHQWGPSEQPLDS
jgi:hypothetical protein